MSHVLAGLPLRLGRAQWDQKSLCSADEKCRTGRPRAAEKAIQLKLTRPFSTEYRREIVRIAIKLNKMITSY